MTNTPVIRNLSPQRTISLFKDQEQRINSISEKKGVRISYPDIVRKGVDLVLNQIEEQEGTL